MMPKRVFAAPKRCSTMLIAQVAPDVQHWIHLGLVWVGFGAVVGWIARAILPLRHPIGSAGTIVVGMIGSTMGLLCYSLFFPAGRDHPLSISGFAASVVACWIVLVLYQPWVAWQTRRAAAAQPSAAAADAPATPADAPWPPVVRSPIGAEKERAV